MRSHGANTTVSKSLRSMTASSQPDMSTARPSYRLVEVNPVFRRYAARDGNHDRLWVTRLLPPVVSEPQPRTLSSLVAAEEHATRRARLRTLTIPPISSVHGNSDGSVDIAEKMPQGVTLKDLVFKTGPLRVDFVAALTWALAAGLTEAHQQQLVHAALSPRKIVIGAGGEVVILDMGLADIWNKTLPGFRFPDTRWEYLFPDPPYTAPELLGSDPSAPSADVFSLAGIVFFSLTGGSPFTGNNAMEVYAQARRGKARSALTLRSDLSPTLVENLRSCFAPFVDNRPATPAALAQLLFGDRQRIDPVTTLVEHYVHHIGRADMDAHLPTISDPDRVTSVAGIVGDPTMMRAQRLLSATDSLQRMRQGAGGKSNKSKTNMIVVVLILVLALLFILPILLRKQPVSVESSGSDSVSDQENVENSAPEVEAEPESEENEPTFDEEPLQEDQSE